MSFSINERVYIAAKALAAGVFDADPVAQWYESVNPYALNLPANKVWIQANTLRQHPAANLTTARANAAGPLTGIIDDKSQYSSAIRLTKIPSINNTYVALTVYNDFSNRLENWVQPQFIPQSNGNPSVGYAIRLFNGNPNSGGTEILTTTGTTGTGSSKSVAWIWNYASGLLALADDFAITDPWVCGFRYIGQTVDDISNGSSFTNNYVQNPTSLDTSALSGGLFGYIKSNNLIAPTDAADISKALCAGVYTENPGSIVTHGVVYAKFSTASGTPTAGRSCFLARADSEVSNGAAGKVTTYAPTSGSVTHVGIVIDDTGFATNRMCKVLLQIAPPVKRS